MYVQRGSKLSDTVPQAEQLMMRVHSADDPEGYCCAHALSRCLRTRLAVRCFCPVDSDLEAADVEAMNNPAKRARMQKAANKMADAANELQQLCFDSPTGSRPGGGSVSMSLSEGMTVSLGSGFGCIMRDSSCVGSVYGVRPSLNSCRVQPLRSSCIPRYGICTAIVMY